MTVLPPDDPHGDREWQSKKRKGRKSILEGVEVWRPGESAGAPDTVADPVPAAGGKAKYEKPAVFDVLKIPRIGSDGTTQWVPNTCPDDMPVTPLGVQGGIFWFLNPQGELIAMEAGKFGQSHIMGLFAPHIPFLNKAWPQFNAQGGWKGFQAQYTAAALMEACALKGVFDARDKVRGLGCWKGRHGEMIQHLGNVVLVGDVEHKPGEIDGYVYPGRPRVPLPTRGGKATVEKVYSMFQSWNWARGELDARLLLGFVACSILGAALAWRPMCFITGDAGYGKSELMNRIKMMLPGRIVSTVDASPAALRQIINQDAVGVLFDEIEADALNDQAQQVMKLARVAASGGTTYRGGKDHSAAEFTLRGCFGFSAIVPPSMRNQDMQRLAFLRLVKKPQGRLEDWTPARAQEFGCAMAGRIGAGWDRWDRTLLAYRDVLLTYGHDQRSSAQFGALLAAADLMLNDGDPDNDTLDIWASQLRRDKLFEYESNTPAWRQAWRTIIQAQPEVWRSDGFPTVGEVVRKYIIAAAGDPKDRSVTPDEERRRNLGDKLARAGLWVVREQKTGRFFLAIPPKHQGVSSIFQGSDFQARGGEGAWTISLRNAPKYEHGEGVYRVEKVPRLDYMKCTLYNLDAVVEGEPLFSLYPDEHDVAEE